MFLKNRFQTCFPDSQKSGCNLRVKKIADLYIEIPVQGTNIIICPMEDFFNIMSEKKRCKR